VAMRSGLSMDENGLPWYWACLGVVLVALAGLVVLNAVVLQRVTSASDSARVVTAATSTIAPPPVTSSVRTSLEVPPFRFPLPLDCSERPAPTTEPPRDGSDSPWIGDTGAAKPPSVNLICWDAPAVGPGAGGR
jgi:hypothetical protein